MKPVLKFRLPALVLLLWHSQARGEVDQGGNFDLRVAPILARRCLDCHSGSDPKGKLDLSRHTTALAGGESGPAIVPGKVGESLLWERISADEMPPKAPLPAAEKTAIRDWIASGASWGTDPIDAFQVSTARRAGRDWWSLQPVNRPAPPAVVRADWARNPIDAFVREKQAASGLAPAGEASRRSLARRLSFDLLGLPPTPEEVDAFVRDTSPAAYEQLVERLLASPHYGVRWARWWLDLARFGESHGFEYDELRPNAWRYRDWVVDAFNRDLGYDEFARLQLAGDVSRPGDPAAITATGFLVAGPYDTPGQNQQSLIMKAVVRGDELEELVGTVGQTFLGLTVNCARCHDHKFDPIRQVEYYGLASALCGVRHGERDLSAILGKGSKAYAVSPREAGAMHVHVRGNPNQLGNLVNAGGVAAVVAPGARFGLPADAPESRRRMALAGWICSARNPLFARVIVNRLWQAHFGVGLVETPSDLGWNGGKPSHPELLDWLASELVEERWSLKAMHRKIVSSATYRQSSTASALANRKDAGDRLLWRKAPVRLEAEMVRDAMLAIAGILDLKLSGPSFKDQQVSQAPGTPAMLYAPLDPRTPGLSRRSLFRLWARGGRSTLLDAFDCPDPSTAAPRRAVTTTPLQALALLNNALVLHLSDAFAVRLVRDAGPDAGRQVERAYRLAFARDPAPDEKERAARVVTEFGPSTLARAIFNSNEFLYLD
jgi:hypothetical protein